MELQLGSLAPGSSRGQFQQGGTSLQRSFPWGLECAFQVLSSHLTVNYTAKNTGDFSQLANTISAAFGVSLQPLPLAV